MRNNILIKVCILFLVTGCSQNSNYVDCASVVNQYYKYNYEGIYVEQGFERIAEQIAVDKYRDDFNQKLTYHISDLLARKTYIKNPYINGYCNNLNQAFRFEENNQTKLKAKVLNIKKQWFVDYNRTISNYDFSKVYIYIKDGKCRKLAKKLNRFFVNKELKHQRGFAQFEMAKKAYNQCIELVVDSGNKGNKKL